MGFNSVMSTSFNPVDQEWMELALEQARKSLYLSNPNPRVGCVIVKNGKVLGMGNTQEIGGPHAEVQALADARSRIDGADDLFGATFYISLEPCSHIGKTPPCVDAVIAAKPKAVFIAMVDPNPKVSGKGIAALEAAGIEVQIGLLEDSAGSLNRGFISRMTRGLPYVRLKIAASLDGFTALPNGQSQWITSQAARDDGHHWRAQACAIISGGGTVKEDDPQLNVRAVQTQRQPVKMIIDSHLEIPLTAKVLQDSNAIVVCAKPEAKLLKEMRAQLGQRGIRLLEMPNPKGKVDLSALFRYLALELEMNEIHIEAGSKLNGSLIREGCVDELLVYLAPTLLGGGLPLANLSPLSSLIGPDRRDWQIVDHTLIGADVRLRLRKLNQ